MVLRSSIHTLVKARVALTQPKSLTRSLSSASSLLSKDNSSSHSKKKPDESQKEPLSDSEKKAQTPDTAKSVSQADAELHERLEKMSGGGGASGIEYEDGKPNAMKRSVRNNMFRLI